VRVIDEIRRQRSVIGSSAAKQVILSLPAFEQLLVEKNELGLHQFNTEIIPPTIYSMSISVADGYSLEVAVI
jgi:hypothetical protein